MTPFEAFLLGLIQAFTEFLPVSSSGHIELGKAFLNIANANDLLFTIIVHFATVLSTLIVYRNDIWLIIKDLFKFEWNASTQFFIKIVISMIPVGIIGLLYKDQIELLFQGSVVFVCTMLLITGTVLAIASRVKPQEKEISYMKAFLVGVAQAIAVLPGISRSGSTITTALMLGVKRTEAARFSFLMVIAPILGMTLLEVLELIETPKALPIGILPLSIGFFTSFIFGIVACKWMIKIVQKSKLFYFAVYCWVIGIIGIIAGLIS